MGIAITGANGFIGSHLKERLKQDRISHIGISHQSTIQEIADILKREKVDSLVHLASVFLGEHKPSDVDLLVDSNVGFGTRVLEACALAGVRKVVMTGSSWQHLGNSSVNLYGALKTGLEAVARYYADAHGISVAFLKLYDSFGPRDPRPKLIPFLLAAYRDPTAKEPLQLSEGAQIVDFTHVDNSVEALIKAIEWTAIHPGKFQDFRVTGREPMSLRQFIALIEETTGHDFKLRWGARPYRHREVMVPWMEAPEIPGFRPLVPLRDGILKVFTKQD